MRRMHPTGNAASCISRENVMVVGQIATLARGGSLSLVSVASAGSRQREPTRPPGHAPARPRSSPSSRPPGCLAVRLPDCVAPCSKCRILCDGWGAWGACTTQVTPHPAFRAPVISNLETQTATPRHRDSSGPHGETKHRGDEGNRTPNPRLAKAVLCQLSYVPGNPRTDPSGDTRT